MTIEQCEKVNLIVTYINGQIRKQKFPVVVQLGEFDTEHKEAVLRNIRGKVDIRREINKFIFTPE